MTFNEFDNNNFNISKANDLNELQEPSTSDENALLCVTPHNSLTETNIHSYQQPWYQFKKRLKCENDFKLVFTEGFFLKSIQSYHNEINIAEILIEGK